MIDGVTSAGGPGSPAKDQKAELKAAAQAFEAVFLRQMIGTMRQASLGDDILGSDAGNQFSELADARTADTLAGKGVLGIADMLIKQFAGPVSTSPFVPSSTDPGSRPGEMRPSRDGGATVSRLQVSPGLDPGSPLRSTRTGFGEGTFE